MGVTMNETFGGTFLAPLRNCHCSSRIVNPRKVVNARYCTISLDQSRTERCCSFLVVPAADVRLSSNQLLPKRKDTKASKANFLTVDLLQKKSRKNIEEKSYIIKVLQIKGNVSHGIRERYSLCDIDG